MARETGAQKLARLTGFDFEWLNKMGAKTLAGIDEVGRGPLAGPVVTACVSIPLDKAIEGVDDSKKLSETRRESLAPKLKLIATFVKTARVEPEEIDSINILNATKRAMEECACGFNGDLVLVDAVEGLRLNAKIASIIGGDAKSYMIAAASIIAKTERDEYMRRMDALYPQYGFARNKGYGTQEHIAAIKKYGPCPIHRLSFIKHFI